MTPNEYLKSRMIKKIFPRMKGTPNTQIYTKETIDFTEIFVERHLNKLYGVNSLSKLYYD